MQEPVFCILGYANDGEWPVIQAETSADGMLSRPITIAEGLIDDGDRLRAVVVAVCKFTASNEIGAQGLKVVWTYGSKIDFHRFVALRDVTFGHNSVAVESETQRREVCQRHGFDAGQDPELGKQTLIKRNSLRA